MTATPSPTRKCLYCTETKPLNAFNTEHVVPVAFGTFGSDTMTISCVCIDCNTKYFGTQIEPKLSRDSIEGVMRFNSGLKSVQSYRHLGKRATLRVEVVDGPFVGAQVFLCPPAAGDQLMLVPPPQIGIARSEGEPLKWYRLDEESLPPNDEIKKAFGQQPFVQLWGISYDEALPFLESRGVKSSGWTAGPMANAGDRMATNIIGQVERKHLRTIAKIAFNYFAFHFEGLAFLEQFDRIRRFVRHDEGNGLVNFAEKPLVVGDPVPQGHAVGIQWDGEHNRCWAQVTLFNTWHYNVLLMAKGFSVLVPPTICGHFFDPKAQTVRRIVPIGAGSVQWRSAD